MTRVLPLLGLLVTAAAAMPHDAAASAPAAAQLDDTCSDRGPDGIESPPALPVEQFVVPPPARSVVTCERQTSIAGAPTVAAPLVVAPKTSPPAGR